MGKIQVLMDFDGEVYVLSHLLTVIVIRSLAIITVSGTV